MTLIQHTPGRCGFQLCLRDFAFLALMVVSRARNGCFDLAEPLLSVVGRDVGGNRIVNTITVVDTRQYIDLNDDGENV